MAIPLTLYVHLPWCERRCPYCDFNAYARRAAIPEEAYVEACLRDLEGDGRPLEAVFLGGGTPSLFSPRAIARLIRGVRERLPLKEGAEITLEANPGTVDEGKLAGFREAGVNRLSLGIQSFQDALLQRIGRIHTGKEAVRAVEAARRAGFENINLDLMFGLPGQGAEEAAADVETALALAPTHVSYYQLTLEPGTPFHRHPPELPEEEALGALEEGGRERLEQGGFVPYEVSAYARPGYACRHNLNYWTFGDYLGIGAGAWGKITTREGIFRTQRERRPGAYMEGSGTRTVRVEDIPMEFMMNALRLTRGFPKALFEARTGLPFETIRGPMEEAKARGLLREDEGHVQPTPLGRRYLNDLLVLFC